MKQQNKHLVLDYSTIPLANIDSNIVYYKIKQTLS